MVTARPDPDADPARDADPGRDPRAAAVAHGGAAPKPPPAGGLAGLALRAYAWLHRLGERGWATTAIGTWAFLQGAVVPGPVDGLIIPFGLADPPKVWRFAWAAVLGSVLGTLVSYGIGVFAFDSVGHVVLGWAGVSDAALTRMRGAFREKGWILVLVSTWTPVSTKLTAISAGAFGVPAWQFVLAIFVGRTVRFVTVAVVVRYFGDRVEAWVERRYGKTLVELARERGGRP
ncbi:MAG: YqaA family protein [Gemmatimonadaceae bacterium]